MKLRFVGLTGPQGCGKTTLCEKIAKYNDTSSKTRSFPGWSFQYTPNKSSRNIIERMNITFNHTFYSDPIKVALFQIAVLEEMIASDIERLSNSVTTKDVCTDVVILSDRTYIDVDVYTTANLSMYPEFQAFIDKYQETCGMFQSLVYDATIIMNARKEVPATDGVRPNSNHYKLLIDALMHPYHLRRYLQADRMNNVNVDNMEAVICAMKTSMEKHGNSIPAPQRAFLLKNSAAVAIQELRDIVSNIDIR